MYKNISFQFFFNLSVIILLLWRCIFRFVFSWCTVVFVSYILLCVFSALCSCVYLNYIPVRLSWLSSQFIVISYQRDVLLSVKPSCFFSKNVRYQVRNMAVLIKYSVSMYLCVFVGFFVCWIDVWLIYSGVLHLPLFIIQRCSIFAEK